jgi:hypothetical protein
MAGERNAYPCRDIATVREFLSGPCSPKVGQLKKSTAISQMRFNVKLD